MRPARRLEPAVPDLVPRWSSDTIHLPLDTVHVWTADLTEVEADPGVLSVDEKARADRFRFVKDRVGYMKRRTVLRHLLAEYSGVGPAQLRFRYLAVGKPELEGSASSLQFSTAHSGSIAMIGVTSDGAIGVDVEQIRANVFDPAAASLVLSPDEMSMIHTHPDHDSAFLRCWVRKEAFAKVSGSGLDRRLRAITLINNRAYVDHEGVRVRDVRCGPGLLGAVASSPGDSVRYVGRWRMWGRLRRP